MNKKPWQTILLVLGVSLLFSIAAPAQDGRSSRAQENSPPKTKATRTPSEVSLQSVTLVNTENAARKAAEESSADAAKTKESSKASSKSKPDQAADGAVLEFRPVDGFPEADSGSSDIRTKSHKKSALKDIHGSMYGTAGSGVGQASQEGGSVGTGSRNGKFNIYLEGEHTHATTPAPH